MSAEQLVLRICSVTPEAVALQLRPAGQLTSLPLLLTLSPLAMMYCDWQERCAAQDPRLHDEGLILDQRIVFAACLQQQCC
jgi:hypothetical protein